MVTTSREPGDRLPSRLTLRVSLLVGLTLLSIYPGAYVYARLSHRLVNYGSFIARPNAMSGIGYSNDELLFFPCVVVEETLRGL